MTSLDRFAVAEAKVVISAIFKNKIYLSIKEEIAEVGVFSSHLETKRMLKRNKHRYYAVGSALIFMLICKLHNCSYSDY